MDASRSTRALPPAETAPERPRYRLGPVARQAIFAAAVGFAIGWLGGCAPEPPPATPEEATARELARLRRAMILDSLGDDLIGQGAVIRQGTRPAPPPVIVIPDTGAGVGCAYGGSVGKC